MIGEVKNIIRSSKFPLLWSSQALSQIAINMMNYLLLVRMFETTSSTLATSLLWITYALPVIFAGPFTSALIDLFDKKKILIVTNFLQSMVILFYALFFGDNIFFAYVMVFFYSFLNQFYIPSENATVSHLVKKESLPFASGLMYMTQQLSLIIGFSMASVIGHIAGFSYSLIICSILLFIAFVCVIFLPDINRVKKEKAILEDSFASFFRSIYQGYIYIKSNKTIRNAFMILITVQVLFSIVVVSVPMIAVEILNVSATLSGFYIVIPAAMGSLFGALYIPAFLKNKWRKRKLIETSILILSFLLFSETLLVYFQLAWIRLFLSFVITFFIGVFFSSIIIPSQTFLQEYAHEEFKGRIFGNMWFVNTVATIFPILFFGAIAEILGIRFLIIFISITGLSIYYMSKRKITYIKNEE